MGYELNAPNVPFGAYRINSTDRAEWYRQGIGVRAALVSDIDRSEVEVFTGYTWRQIAYAQVDPMGVSTPIEPVLVTVNKDAVAPAHLVESTLMERSATAVQRIDQTGWDQREDRFIREQKKILRAYAAGDVEAFDLMRKIARYTGFTHARHAFSRPIDGANPSWKPDIDIRLPLDFMTSWGKVYVPNLPFNIPAANRWGYLLGRNNEMMPLLRGRNEKLLYIGGQMTTLPMMTYAIGKGINLDVVDTDQVGRWAAQGFLFHHGFGKVRLHGNDSHIEKGLQEGCSTIVIANTAYSTEFNLCNLLFAASQAMKPYKGHPPQIIIQERAPFGLPPDKQAEMKAKYEAQADRTKCLLLRHGFKLEQEHISATGNFLFRCTLPEQNPKVPFPQDDGRILTYQTYYDQTVATA